MDNRYSPALVFSAGVGVTLLVMAMMGVFQDDSSQSAPLSVPVLGEVADVSRAEAKVTLDHTTTSLVGATEITCTYPRVLSASYMDGQVTHELPAAEKNPMIFTFSDLYSQNATLKYIDATRTISETPILKIYEDNSKLVFVDGDGSGYLTTHTIFKNNGVAAYAKEVDLLGIPAGSLAMGTCVGY